MTEMSNIIARPLAEHSAVEAASAMERCFEGYVVPVRMTPEAWERRFRAEHLDAFASRIYWRGDAPVAVLFVTRRGWTCRIGGMAVAASERGRGLGRQVMEQAILDGKARGDRRMLLEVIEQNARAIALYTSVGFRTGRRLVGYQWTPEPVPPSTDTLVEADPREAARVAMAESEPDLPWMLAPETLTGAAPPMAAFSLEGKAWAVIANPSAETMALSALIVPRAHRLQGWGTRMLRALAAAFPGKPWAVNVTVPEELAAEFFSRNGWTRRDITQFEMEAPLAGAARAGPPDARP